MPRLSHLLVTLTLCASTSAFAAQSQKGATTPAQPSSAGKITPHVLHPTTSTQPLFVPMAAPKPVAKAAAKKTGPARHKKHHRISSRDRNRAAALSVKGTKALLANHPHEAMLDFERAAALDPENKTVAESAGIARETWVTQLVHDAAKARLSGNDVKARQDLAEAYHLAPENPEVTQNFAGLLTQENHSTHKSSVDVHTPGPPVELLPRLGQHSFHFRAPAHQVIERVMKAWGIDATCDNSVTDKMVDFNTGSLSFKTAMHALELTTNTFTVPLDPARVLFVRNNASDRMNFQRQLMETIYLPGVSHSERTHILQIVRSVFHLQKVTYDAGSHALTVRGPEPQLHALNHTLKGLLKGESQILLSVKMYLLSRTRTTNEGVLLPSQTTLFNLPSELRSIISNNQSLVNQIISSGLASPGDYAAIAAILLASGQLNGGVLNQPFAIFGNGLTTTGMTASGITAHAALNSSSVTALEDMQMLALNRQEEEIRSGTRYPIITSSYSNLAGSNLSIPGITSAGVSSALSSLGINASSLISTQESIPQVQYQNLGLTLHVTPFVEGHGVIGLKLSLKLDTLEGTSINDIPVLSSRQINSITSLKPGQSAVIVSSVSKQDANAITGIPGINEIPGLRGGTHQKRKKNIGELAVVITPRVVRRVHSRRASTMIILPAK